MTLSSAVAMVAMVAMATIIHEVTAASLAAKNVNLGGELIAYFKLNFGSKVRDFTEINRDICPPSLCEKYTAVYSSVRHSSDHIPRGTADSIFFQGDIILDKELSDKIFSKNSKFRYTRATVRDRDRLWKNGEVKFEMHQEINAKSQRALRNAMRHISNHTCITFKERTSQDSDYILFTSEPGCWSQIGRTTGTQKVNIGDGCENMGTAAHEIMHALGMWHEQARQDRDSYVQVLYENIVEKFKPDFDMAGGDLSTSLDHPYDYLSLMHYSSNAFTKNGNPTIKVVGVGERLGVSIGQRSTLSGIDISQLREMYACNLQSRVDHIATCHSGNFSDGRDYRGQIDYTLEGYTCQKWTDIYPHNHTLAAYSRTAIAQSTDGLGDHNRCRNPGALRRNRPWCYTTKTSSEWGYCDIRVCQKTPSIAVIPVVFPATTAASSSIILPPFPPPMKPPPLRQKKPPVKHHHPFKSKTQKKQNRIKSHKKKLKKKSSSEEHIRKVPNKKHHAHLSHPKPHHTPHRHKKHYTQVNKHRGSTKRNRG